MVRERPVAGVVEQDVLGVRAVRDLLDDLLREGACTGGGVEAGLGLRSGLGADDLDESQYTESYSFVRDTDDAVEPLQ